MTDSSLRFIASYPESGGQWAGALVAAYLDRRTGEEISHLPSDVDAAYYHQASPLPPRNLGFGTQIQTRSAALLALSRSAGSARDRPVATSHHAAVVHQGLSLFSTVFTEKVAVVVRDPRDVAISVAERLDASLDDAVDFMADRERVLAHDNDLAHAVSAWSTHLATWLQYDAAPTRFFRFEDLLAETEEELTKILGFLDVTEAVDRDRVREAVDHASFDAVARRHRELTAEGEMPQQRRICRRKGVGLWREALDERHLSAIEEEHGGLMRAAGYEPLLVTDVVADETVSSSEPTLDPDVSVGAVTDAGLGSRAETGETGAGAG